jgi:glycosyltransferase involved in cell wall biosynthesis
VRRFNVSKKRDPIRFGQIQNKVFYHQHTTNDELKWLNEEGPYCPSLIDFVKKNYNYYDFFIFFSYRYYQSYYGVKAVSGKSILVPTAERDGAITLSIFKELFNLPRAIIYNSHEEKRLIQAYSNNYSVPGDIVGVGSEIPAWIRKERFREKYKVDFPYIIYIGRIDENKGCKELLEFFIQFHKDTKSPVHLILIGNSVIDIPEHPFIHHLGFVSDEDKFSALASAEFLVMPSYYESLSMVLLEAWAVEKPALVNGNCEVLKGQCIRSNGGLFYQNYQEFKELMLILLGDKDLQNILGKNGKKYYDNNYDLKIIANKYERMLYYLTHEN